jgi:hypothetical protein
MRPRGEGRGDDVDAGDNRAHPTPHEYRDLNDSAGYVAAATPAYTLRDMAPARAGKARLTETQAVIAATEGRKCRDR